MLSDGAMTAATNPHIPIDIAGIDFETATAKRSSACAVGIAIPQINGNVMSKSWLIRPPDNEYAGINIGIHGIHPAQTKDSPALDEAWPEISAYLGDRTLAAHNTAFDMSVLEQSLSVSESTTSYEYKNLCTLQLSEAVWPDKQSYKLRSLAEELGHNADNHHDPLWDAWAVTQIAAALIATCGVETLGEVAEAHGYGYGQISSDRASSRAKRGNGGRSRPQWRLGDLTQPGDTQPKHPLFGRCVVISGALPNGMSRGEALQEVINIGGSAATHITKKVDLLVVKDLKRQLAKDKRHSKLQKAIDVAANGQNVELMDARNFCILLATK